MMSAFWKSLSVALAAASVLAAAPEDSVWVHIEAVDATIDKAGKVVVKALWSAYKSSYSESTKSWGDWFPILDENLKFLAQCATDSLFTNIVAAGTTDAQSFVFAGLEKGKRYFVRSRLVGFDGLCRSDVASVEVSGKSIFKAFWAQNDRFWALVCGIGATALGMSTIGVVIVREKRKQKAKGGGDD